MNISNDTLEALIKREIYNVLPLPSNTAHREHFVKDFYNNIKDRMYSQDNDKELRFKNKYVLLSSFIEYTSKENKHI